MRAQLVALFEAVIAACALDRPALYREQLAALGVDPRRRRFGLAIGKAAIAMARGAGEVEDGVVIAPHDDGRPLPKGWRRFVSAHPQIDARSAAAFEIASRIVEDDARSTDVVIALVSGGASALLESPRGDITLEEMSAVTSAVMAAGAPIAELNVVRSALSSAKAGGLVLSCAAPVITLAVSDIVDDDIFVIGSAPTCGAWLVAERPSMPTLSTKPPAPEVLWPRAVRDDEEDELELPDVFAHATVGPVLRSNGAPFDAGRADAVLRQRASELLAAHGIDVPPSVAAVLALPAASFVVSRDDRARVIQPMRGAAAHAAAQLLEATFFVAPIVGDVTDVADALAAHTATVVAWGEPTLVVPPGSGEGGRAQQLALELARRLRGTTRCALVVGTDGADGPAPAARPTPAGAFVDGTTWDAIVQAGLDPDVALARRDAGSALAAVDALVVTGPTGINHADLVIIGEEAAFAVL